MPPSESVQPAPQPRRWLGGAVLRGGCRARSRPRQPRFAKILNYHRDQGVITLATSSAPRCITACEADGLDRAKRRPPGPPWALVPCKPRGKAPQRGVWERRPRPRQGVSLRQDRDRQTAWRAHPRGPPVPGWAERPPRASAGSGSAHVPACEGKDMKWGRTGRQESPPQPMSEKRVKPCGHLPPRGTRPSACVPCTLRSPLVRVFCVKCEI